jgi:diguanylate cyclase (GGDEF)-like protein
MLFFAATVQCHIDTPDALSQLMKRFEEIPCVVVGCEVPGLPAVTSNGYIGFKKLVEHFIVAHGHRRIAMIEGPPSNTDAQERLAAYLDAHHEAGIAPDPQLRVRGAYTAPTGASAVEALLQRGVAFDALVCANDEMALGALSVSAARGLNVPEDLALGGFDDMRSVTNVGPSLTSVNQDIAAQAHAALGLLLKRMAGRSAAPQIRLASRLVLRHSCGCMSAAASPASGSEPLHVRIQDLVAGLNLPSDLQGKLPATVLALRSALLAPDGGREFETLLTRLFETWRVCKADSALLKQLLLDIQARLLGDLPAEALPSAALRLQRGQILLAGATELLLNLEHAAVKGKLNLHLQFKPRVMSDDMASMLAGLAEGLAQLKIDTCFVALYASPVTLEMARAEGLPPISRLVFALDGGVDHPEWCEQAFPTRELLPEAAARRSRPEASKPLQLMPMFHLNEHFGFIVLERQLVDRFPFEELRHEITGSLHHCLLIEQLAAARERLRLELERANSANDVLSHIAMRDALTGLFNRRGFLQLAQAMMHGARRSGHTLSLIFADMDGLKQINDTLGHDEGDEAIRQAATVLQHAFRHEDIVARIGGDEFVALTPGGAQDTLTVIEQRVARRFAEFNATSGKPYLVACSLGGYLVDPFSKESLDEMLAHADRVMYAEKRRRREEKAAPAGAARPDLIK